MYVDDASQTDPYPVRENHNPSDFVQNVDAASSGVAEAGGVEDQDRPASERDKSRDALGGT